MAHPSNTTRRFDVTPCIMLVALADGEAQLCTGILKPFTATKPMQITRVAHVRAASERMLVTRPMIVVYSESLADPEKKVIAERAEDVGAVAVLVPTVIEEGALRQSLFLAVREASLRHGY